MNDLIPVYFTFEELGVLCDIIKSKSKFYNFLDFKLHREYNDYMSNVFKSDKDTK